MATVNIGNLTFTHRGDYAGGTAYAKNDVVYYSTNGNAYIAKQATTGNAPTNGTYWSQFAAGSGGIWNAGLSLGSGSQQLRVNSSGNALEFFTPVAASSDFERVITAAGDGTAVLDVDNCFTSGYENYLILGNVYTSSTTACYIRLQDSNNSEISSNYFYVGYQAYKGSSNQGNDIKTGWNQGEWSPQENIASETEGYGQFAINVSKPYINNHYTGMHIQYNAYDSANFRYVWSNCFLRDANTHKGFRFYVTSGNITSSSSISVYGMKTS